MAKTLYSLMLSEPVVREIDLLAHRRGLTRSALINQILAEYAGFTTPERRINDIFAAMEALLAPSRELVPYFVPNQATMSMKSSLEYKYRPTVKYEVALYEAPGEDGAFGELTVALRTQSEGLLSALTEFFRLFKRAEDAQTGGGAAWALYGGRLTRSLTLPRDRDNDAQGLARAISGYVEFFDGEMKKYLSGGLTAAGLERDYARWLRQGNTAL